MGRSPLTVVGSAGCAAPRTCQLGRYIGAPPRNPYSPLIAGAIRSRSSGGWDGPAHLALRTSGFLFIFFVFFRVFQIFFVFGWFLFMLFCCAGFTDSEICSDLFFCSDLKNVHILKFL
jgi:hypothetical protein